MKLKKAFELALNNLFHSKLRSWLTIIGIIIGIGAVVSIVSLSTGAKESLESSLGDLGADLITITPGSGRAMGGGFGGPGGGFGGESSSGSDNFTSRNILALEGVDNVKTVMGKISSSAEVEYSDKSSTVTVEGVEVREWLEIVNTELSEGRFLTTSDKNAVVVGGRVAEQTFDGELLLNTQIEIEGKLFRIVGILEEGTGSGDDDNKIIMPIDIARTILEDIPEDNEYATLIVKVEDVDILNNTLEDVEDKMMLSRGILFEKDQDFSISNSQSIRETISSTLDTMALFLGAIAAISLIVGGVGIANTMFTSVLEKTREIGILKAIGAKDGDVLKIFLFSSGLIGFVGGLGGIFVGIIVSAIINYANSGTEQMGRGMMNMFSSSSIDPWVLVGALLFAVVIGVVAGAIPAYRASKLSPVDALRYE